MSPPVLLMSPPPPVLRGHQEIGGGTLKKNGLPQAEKPGYTHVVNDKIITPRLDAQFAKVSVIQIYVPVKSGKDKTKDI